MSVTHRLDEVCSIIMGQAPKGEAYNTEEKGWPLIAGAGDFSAGRLSPKKWTTEASKLSRSGDIVLSIRASIGTKVWSEGEYCLGRGVAALRPTAAMDAGFLWHWLTFKERELASKGKGATFLQVNRSDIGGLQVELPPLPEQRRIAAVLEQVDALRVKRRTAVTLLDDLAGSVFTDMFGTGSGDIPLVRVDELCSLVVDCVNRTAPTVDRVTPFKMIRTTNVRSGRVDLRETRHVEEDVFKRWNRRATPRRGDVVLTREAPVGEVGVLATDDQVFLGQRLMLYRVDPARATAAYLSAALRSPYLKGQYEQSGSGSTVKHLSLPTCRGLKIPAPDLAAQEQFAARIAKLDELKEQHGRQLEALDELFGSLQHRAFAGRLWDRAAA
ncbi:hypothetical protein AR457_10555 [Streptomyces agglomeratus]|uniref:Type I restriction modification DNA specificity domain-containing protein n=1 Tax=Streptomyces agglomeratus TaxID=285458 RepID=A0A1E5P5N8_9ACTN|nr:restriction endonuclease subunit S [Streptomyces agglomeratus]OEJ24845.1 hypothetical protein AS594_10500 [Streptomyces agglomeratus]OEJ41146.1 hypothetical protein BGK70_26100 [Streptomyces agglomeratus]OEJ44476.1 hypothetical protein AR457_10555 [Streptomyces agglomeratus]OEJ53687.1 hypothetical protein BGK72_25715 [Streptomyces agglomeratus]OEJ61005.1 hypothetical protein BGM19_26315 [Streptomyces agglomeratus]